MSFQIKKVGSHLWNEMMSEDAHMVCFGERRSRDLDKASFALMAIDQKGDVAGYVTCIEMDGETLYWQYGGAMPEYKNTIHTIRGYAAFINRCCEEYKRITTRIDNENIVMLKLAMKLGFRITGTHHFKNNVYVELTLEFGRGL